jgi:DNA-binding protein H-NS
MTDLQQLSEIELKALSDNIEKALKDRQRGKRKEIIAQIKELATSIDMTVELHPIEKQTERKVNKVAIQYRDPNNHNNTWTGRGVMPVWLRELIQSGRDRSEFKI